MQALGDVNGLHALQKIDQCTVKGKRNRKGEQPSGFPAVCDGGFLYFPEQAVRQGQRIKAEIDGGKAYQHGSGFPDDQPDNGKADGGGIAFCRVMGINQINAPYTDQLFHQLCRGRHGGLTDAVKISVDAGMYGGHGDGKRDDAQQRRGSWLKQEICRNRIGKQVNIGGTSGGEQHGNAKSGKEGAEGSAVIAGGSLACHELGNGGLHTGYGDGKGQRQHRRGELVQPHAFRPEHTGEKNTVKKADKTAGETGNGENDGACNERIGFLHAIPVLRICL